jgi:hypothetical protein
MLTKVFVCIIAIVFTCGHGQTVPTAADDDSSSAVPDNTGIAPNNQSQLRQVRARPPSGCAHTGLATGLCACSRRHPAVESYQ